MLGFQKRTKDERNLVLFYYFLKRYRAKQDYVIECYDNVSLTLSIMLK